MAKAQAENNQISGLGAAIWGKHWPIND